MVDISLILRFPAITFIFHWQNLVTSIGKRGQAFNWTAKSQMVSITNRREWMMDTDTNRSICHTSKTNQPTKYNIMKCAVKKQIKQGKGLSETYEFG